jgi:hypothetical protein
MKFGSILVAFVLIGASPAFAHHSFAAEYDRNQPVTVTGTVNKVEWMNPHARFSLDVKEENGQVVTWDFELGSPNVLIRWGWNRKTLQPGDTVTVTAYRAKNAPHVANASSVALADGKKVLTASSADLSTK